MARGSRAREDGQRGVVEGWRGFCYNLPKGIPKRQLVDTVWNQTKCELLDVHYPEFRIDRRNGWLSQMAFFSVGSRKDLEKLRERTLNIGRNSVVFGRWKDPLTLRYIDKASNLTEALQESLLRDAQVLTKSEICYGEKDCYGKKDAAFFAKFPDFGEALISIRECQNPPSVWVMITAELPASMKRRAREHPAACDVGQVQGPVKSRREDRRNEDFRQERQSSPRRKKSSHPRPPYPDQEWAGAPVYVRGGMEQVGNGPRQEPLEYHGQNGYARPSDGHTVHEKGRELSFPARRGFPGGPKYPSSPRSPKRRRIVETDPRNGYPADPGYQDARYDRQKAVRQSSLPAPNLSYEESDERRERTHQAGVSREWVVQVRNVSARQSLGDFKDFLHSNKIRNANVRTRNPDDVEISGRDPTEFSELMKLDGYKFEGRRLEVRSSRDPQSIPSRTDRSRHRHPVERPETLPPSQSLHPRDGPQAGEWQVLVKDFPRKTKPEDYLSVLSNMTSLDLREQVRVVCRSRGSAYVFGRRPDIFHALLGINLLEKGIRCTGVKDPPSHRAPKPHPVQAARFIDASEARASSFDLRERREIQAVTDMWRAWSDQRMRASGALPPKSPFTPGSTPRSPPVKRQKIEVIAVPSGSPITPSPSNVLKPTSPLPDPELPRLTKRILSLKDKIVNQGRDKDIGFHSFCATLKDNLRSQKLKYTYQPDPDLKGRLVWRGLLRMRSAQAQGISMIRIPKSSIPDAEEEMEAKFPEDEEAILRSKEEANIISKLPSQMNIKYRCKFEDVGGGVCPDTLQVYFLQCRGTRQDHAYLKGMVRALLERSRVGVMKWEVGDRKRVDLVFCPLTGWMAKRLGVPWRWEEAVGGGLVMYVREKMSRETQRARPSDGHNSKR